VPRRRRRAVPGRGRLGRAVPAAEAGSLSGAVRAGGAAPPAPADRSGRGPGAPPGAPGGAADPGGADTIRTVRRLRINLVKAGVIALALVPLGAVAGLLWSAIAPAAQYVVTEAGPRLADPETQALIEADGWFAVITAAFGLLTGAAAYAVGRRAPVGALLGLVAGGCAAAYVALLVGGAAAETARAADEGITMISSLDVTAPGVLVAWPLFATVVFGAIEFVIGYPPPGETAYPPPGEATET